MLGTWTGWRAGRRLMITGVSMGVLGPGVRDATQFAPHCPQAATPFGQASTENNFAASHKCAFWAAV